ncbi:MAG: hypothetical protein ACLFRV_14355 [Acidimicrobiales bacterium]
MGDTRYRLNAPAVAAEELDGEVIAINMSTGVYYSMTGWSAWAWSALTSGMAPTEVGAILSDHGAQDGQTAAAGFADELVDERLVVERAPGVVPDPGPAGPPDAPVDDLVLQRFTDMEDLILLDPVHDVDTTAGWPRPAPVE